MLVWCYVVVYILKFFFFDFFLYKVGLISKMKFYVFNDVSIVLRIDFIVVVLLGDLVEFIYMLIY